jgi:hypothetical protein
MVNEFVGILNDFRANASQCEVNPAKPKAASILFRHKGRNRDCEEITLTEALCIGMDIAGSTPLAGRLPDGQLEIFVYPKETYFTDHKGSKVLKTTTEVGYVHKCPSTPKGVLLCGVHYDYEVADDGNPREAHPFYHAQISRRLNTLTDILAGLKVKMENCPHVPFLRFPTAHMSLASVLLGIAADCFKPPDFKAFLTAIRKRPVYGLYYSDKLLNRIQANSNSFASCSWYKE